MPLTAASALWYWDSRWGPMPIVGGEPVFSRAGSATFVDRRGMLRRLVRSTPRLEWRDMGGTVQSQPEPVLLLELARTNRCLFSEEFETSWSLSNVTVTAGVSDPMGGTSARTLNATVTGGFIARIVTFVGSGEKAASIHLRKSTGIAELGIFDNSLPGWRHLVRVTWTNGVPVLSTVSGSGQLVAPQRLANDWWRISFTADGVIAANANVLQIYPAGVAGSGSVQAFGAQAEDGAFTTSYIATGASVVSRAVEQFYWRAPRDAIASIGYLRFVAGLSSASPGAGANLLHFGLAPSDPRLSLFVNSGGALTVFYDNGTAVATIGVGSPFVPGDVVEVAWNLRSTGETRIIAATNGGMPFYAASSPPAGGLVTNEWSQDRLYLNENGAGAEIPAQRYSRVGQVHEADVDAPFDGTANASLLDELRRFQLGPSGAQLVG